MTMFERWAAEIQSKVRDLKQKIESPSARLHSLLVLQNQFVVHRFDF